MTLENICLAIRKNSQKIDQYNKSGLTSKEINTNVKRIKAQNFDLKFSLSPLNS